MNKQAKRKGKNKTLALVSKPFNGLLRIEGHWGWPRDVPRCRSVIFLKASTLGISMTIWLLGFNMSHLFTKYIFRYSFKRLSLEHDIAWRCFPRKDPSFSFGASLLTEKPFVQSHQARRLVRKGQHLKARSAETANKHIWLDIIENQPNSLQPRSDVLHWCMWRKGSFKKLRLSRVFPQIKRNEEKGLQRLMQWNVVQGYPLITPLGLDRFNSPPQAYW